MRNWIRIGRISGISIYINWGWIFIASETERIWDGFQ